MTASRREFLIKSAVGLTGIALSPALESMTRRLLGQSSSYGSAIAATTGRKYACLIGIDRYSNGLDPLQGCTTDVNLQQEVLAHRFGFTDIVTLTDRDATREAIEQNLIENLLDRVTASDTVVIHFSGYGHTLPDGTPLLLSANSSLPTSDEIDALPLETLYQVVQALPTNRVSVVLDCGFTAGDPVEEGNWRLRSPVIPATDEAITYELAPAILERQTALSDTYRSAPRPGSFTPNQIAQAKGNWLLAASPGDSAAEGMWDGFSAGLFTYLLTQSLWDSTGRDNWKQVIQLTSVKADRTVARDDKPSLQGKGNSSGLYSPSSSVPHGISGAISQMQTSQAEIWLGGVSPTVLPFLNAGTRFRSCTHPQDSGSRNSGRQIINHQEWVLRSRDKLTAQVDLATPTLSAAPPESQSSPSSPTSSVVSNPKPISSAQPAAEIGTLVKEIERVIPVARLAIALDTSLERIEKVDVTSALSSASLAGEMRAIETAQLHERSVDCLIGCMTPDLQAQLAIDSPSEVGSYGLMWSGRSPILDTFGTAGEAPKSAVKRLVPRLQHLLAAKRLRTTINHQSSEIPVVLEVTGSDTVWQEGTAGAIARAPLVRKLRKGVVGLPELAVGSSLTYAIDNRGDVPLHVLLLVFDRLGGLSALANGSGVATDNPAAGDIGTFIIPPRSKVNLAQPLGLNLAVRAPKGLTEVVAIASTDPLANSGIMLQEIAKEMGVNSGLVTLPRPLDLTQAIVTELTMAGPTEDTRLLKHTNHATLSLAYTVV